MKVDLELLKIAVEKTVKLLEDRGIPRLTAVQIVADEVEKIANERDPKHHWTVTVVGGDSK